jgi:hypothetical protein
MGAELRAYFKNALGEAAGVSGRAIGSDGTPDGVRVLITGQADKGIPDGIYRFNTKNVRVAEGLLTDEYIESQGLDSSDLPGDIDLDNLPSIDTLERVDITPDDLRLANEGINSPEGQQMSEFKNSPEGQAIARLDEETAATVQRKVDTNPVGSTAQQVWTSSAPGGDTRTRNWTKTGDGKWTNDATGEKLDNLPEDPDMFSQGFGRGGWGGIEVITPAQAKRGKQHDQVGDFFPIDSAKTSQGVDTPTGDKALEDLGYTKTGVDPDREQWASEGQIEAESGLPSVGISKQDDGTWETVNYETGEIFPGATKDESIGKFYEQQREATPEEIAAAEAEDKAKAAEAEKLRQAEEANRELAA